MGKYITVDDTFCYLNFEKQGVLSVLKIKPIEQQLREKIKDERILFKDYLFSSPPWHKDFNRHEKEYRKYYEREIEIFNFILNIYPKNDDGIATKLEVSPICLINFLQAYCWINGNYESESLFIANGEIDYAIYESSNNLFFGRKRGDRIIAFRYSEFEKLELSLIDGSSPAFRLVTKICGCNGRMDKKWNRLYLH